MMKNVVIEEATYRLMETFNRLGFKIVLVEAYGSWVYEDLMPVEYSVFVFDEEDEDGEVKR